LLFSVTLDVTEPCLHEEVGSTSARRAHITLSSSKLVATGWLKCKLSPQLICARRVHDKCSSCARRASFLV